ncbi:MAG: hypothetical protein IT207_01765 [Fimbriimonadaceae bacterium]|nr:hypothetical protein [Fimbriimonadaceae bacterium]
MDPQADATIERLTKRVGPEATEMLVSICRSAPASERALSRFEEWLSRSANTEALVQEVAEKQGVARLVAALLSSSAGIADAVIQSPEIGASLFSPGLWASPPTSETIQAELDSLLANSTSHTHSLDRLRYCMQSVRARILIAELAGAWGGEAVWKGFSDLADVLLAAALRLTSEAGVEPLGIVAWGKLGGQELNVSSDVDLVLVGPDGASEGQSDTFARTAQKFSRAVSDPMGRGFLYRVDFRLRPFGGTGPLVPLRSAVEAYYQKYAEPWEVLAMVRSRPIGDASFCAWWDGLREATVFRPSRSQIFLDSLVEVRERIEAKAGPEDFKGGPGGIRDVEFLTQILQVLNGHRVPALRVRGTLPVVRALAESGEITKEESVTLGHGYLTLREIEHRCQMWNDTPAYCLPSDAQTLDWLARGLGFVGGSGLRAHLAAERADIRHVYASRLGTGSNEPTNDLRRAVGAAWSTMERLLGPVESGNPVWAVLEENESSLERLIAIATELPAFAPEVSAASALVEEVVSGEILESLPLHVPSGTSVAKWANGRWLRCLARQALTSRCTFSEDAAEVARVACAEIAREMGTDLTLAALGSFATAELVPRSDLDVLILASDEREDSDTLAEALVGKFQSLRAEGFPWLLDLRLRPNGRKGRLVITPRSLEIYADRAMEDWERLAWGRARLIFGDECWVANLLSTARGEPLDRVRLEGLLAMRRRIQSERVQVSHRLRHVKLSPGTLLDIDWLGQLLVWSLGRVPAPTEPAGALSRLALAAEAGLLSDLEVAKLSDAHEYLLRLRVRLGTLGFPDDVVPENPDKLAVLARLQCSHDGNEVLAQFESHRRNVESVFEEVVARI